MKIIQRFCCQVSPDVHSLLEANHIQYTLTLFPGNREYTVFDIPEDDPAFFELVHKHNLRPSSISKVLFSKQEMLEAEWFTCCATNAKVELERTEETYIAAERIDRYRARHFYLSGKPFYVKKPIKHRPEQCFFFAYKPSTTHIFCDNRAKKALSESFDEITFQPVLNAKSNLPVDDLHYMRIEKELDGSAVILPSDIGWQACPVCGEITYYPPLQLELRADSLQNIKDVCKTTEIFSLGGNFKRFLIVVSKRFYQFIQQHNMGRSLEFRPVILRDDTNEEAFLQM